MMGPLFFKPANGRAGDFMPYFWKGTFYLFYLPGTNSEDHDKYGTPCALVTTEDFVHFVDHGVVIPQGTEDDHDRRIATGSVIHKDGLHHFFYTGYNARSQHGGGPTQVIMHAVSADLLHWAKVPEDSFAARTDLYELDDWRDPFVFWNEDAGQFWMLLAARSKAGPRRRRGCLALCVSSDLHRWEIRQPFWAPNLYHTHECPDLFRIGDWWYLLFSEFSGSYRTRYRMARSLYGPWLTPADDLFDARAFYAAKTASDGERRYLCGWSPARSGQCDAGLWLWGGDLVVHQLQQKCDGTLAARPSDSLDGVLKRNLPVQIKHRFGDVRDNDDVVVIHAPGGFASAAADMMPECCKIEARAEFAAGTRAFGLMLRASDDLDTAYYCRLEPMAGRLRFECWLPGFGPSNFTNIDVIPDAMAGLERLVGLSPCRPVELKLIVDGTMVVIYVDQRIAMSARMYDMPRGRWGLFVDQGTVEFNTLKIMTL